MTDPSWTDIHARLMSDARPDDVHVSEADYDAVWEQIASSIASTAGRPRRRLTLVAGGGVAAAVLAVGGVAAAVTLSAHTGTYNQGWEVEVGGPGEVLNPKAPDYPEVIHQVVADIPFPSQRARDISWKTQQEDSQGGLLSTGALRGFTADDAICSWANTWASAVRKGDTAAREAATSQLNAAGSWPAVLDMDPEQKMIRKTTVLLDSHDGTELARQADDSTRFGYLSLVRKAAAGDDVDAMGAALAGHVRCISALMPDLPQSQPEAGR